MSGVREQLEGNRKRGEAGDFGYRSMVVSAAVIDSKQGRIPRQGPAAIELCPYLEEVARVQAVKCTPLGDRSFPSREMRERCPSKFLAKELDVLRPGALIVMGDDAWLALERIGDVVWNKSGIRGVFASHGREMEVFWVPHPASRGAWPHGLARLIRSLRRRPAGF